MTHFKHICTGAEFGTYTGCVVITTPQGRLADIDACLVPEIASLWAGGIRTLESCCGHGRVAGYIAVPAEYIEQMRELGYVDDEGHQGCFLTKTNVHSERITELEQDAARYRWLTQDAYIGECFTERGTVLEICGTDREIPVHHERSTDRDEVDAAIDAAMTTQAATERP